MVVDTSALIAILNHEPERESYLLAGSRAAGGVRRPSQCCILN